MTHNFKVFGFQIDVARQLERPEVLLKAAEEMPDYGYNACQLYLEDAYQYPRHGKIARKNAYSPEFMLKLQKLCEKGGMELIPVIPALGHAGYITSKPGYDKYDEGRGTGKLTGTLSPSFPETYKLVKELFEDWCKIIPGKFIHAGLDESVAMGQFHIRKYGIKTFDAPEMFAEHANKLADIADSLGRRLVIWGDMLYYMPDSIKLLRKDIIISDWYYYAFKKTPRVEAFNFADIDLSGNLKKAGFEVWGIPSVWPNKPFPNLVDRAKHFSDWVRYGKEKKIEGIIVSDWENSNGFYDASDLLYKSFGLMENKADVKTFMPALRKVLKKEIGRLYSEKYLSAICSLGKWHLTGRQHGRALRSPESMAVRNHVQRKLYASAEMELGKFISQKTQTSGQKAPSFVSAAQLSGNFIYLYWRTGRILSDVLASVKTPPGKQSSLKKVLAELEGDLADIKVFSRGYAAYWNKVRYSDDPVPVLKWCDLSMKVLQNILKELKGENPNIPLFRAPSLEGVFICRHPALPIARIAVEWADGTVQNDAEVMIRFESEFAKPDAEWRQLMSLRLEKKEIPARIRVSSVCYGEVGIAELAVFSCGEKILFKPVGTNGKNASVANGIVWLGPYGATVKSPLSRTDEDTAVFESCS